MTFGGDFKRQDRNTTTDQNARGTFAFSGIATSAFSSSGQPIPNTGFDFADFLLGLPQSSSVQFGGDSTYFRQNAWDVYANDDWRVNPNLTLMFGLRYEYYSPLTEKYGHLANLDIASDFTAVTRRFIRATRGISGQPDRAGSPRLGAARRPGVETEHEALDGGAAGLRHLLQSNRAQPPGDGAFRAASLRRRPQRLTTSTADVADARKTGSRRPRPTPPC